MYESNWWRLVKYLRGSSGVCSPDQPSETGKIAKGQISLLAQILEEEKKITKQKAAIYRNVDINV